MAQKRNAKKKNRHSEDVIVAPDDREHYIGRTHGLERER